MWCRRHHGTCLIVVFVMNMLLGQSDTARWSVKCPKPDVMDGIVIPDKHEYAAGDLLDITCNEGYTRIENARLKCHNDGTWSGSPPYCEELQCPKLPGIQGLRQNKQTSIGGVIEFECEKGFRIVGNATLYCDENSRWVPSVMPHCSVIGCQELPQLMNGSTKLQKSIRNHSMAMFRCDDKFVLDGPSVLECGEDGTWLPDIMPRCDITTDGSASEWKIHCIVVSVLVSVVAMMCMIALFFIRQLRQKRLEHTGNIKCDNIESSVMIRTSKYSIECLEHHIYVEEEESEEETTNVETGSVSMHEHAM